MITLVCKKATSVKHLTSEGMYEEILPGVDLHYTIQSQRLKENIRLKTAQAAEQELIFHLRYTDMEMKKEEDGSLGPVSYTHLDVYKRQDQTCRTDAEPDK